MKMIIKVIVQCGIQINDEYWFAAGNTNGLFKKNLLTGELFFIGSFPDEEKIQFRAYTDVKLVDNKLIFTPCYAKRIAVYDLEEQKFITKLLPNFEGGINQYIKSVKFKNSIYFIPFSASLFIKYNVSENDVKNLSGWEELRSRYLDQDSTNLVIETICIDKNYLYMFMNNKNQIIVLNMDTDQFQVKSLNISSNEKVCAVCRFKRHIWIVTNKNRIYKLDYISDDIVLVIDFTQYVSVNYVAHYIYTTGKYVYLINVYDKDIRVFDYIYNEFYTIDMSKHIGEKNSDCISLYYYYDIQGIKENKIRLFSFCDGKYITVDGNQVADSYDGFYLKADYIKECFQEYFKNEILYEGKVHYILQHFDTSVSAEIINIFMQDRFAYDDSKEQKNIGKLVYNYLIKTEM